MLREKAIINVQFKSTFSIKKLHKISYKHKDEMANINGLIIKYYYVNPETKIIGGTYFFEDIFQARDYLNHFFLKGIGLQYGVIPDTLKVEINVISFEVKGTNTKQERKGNNLS